MARQAYVVRATARIQHGNAMRMMLAAYTDTPDEAIELVRGLLAADTSLEATGETLSPIIVQAIGLKPGQAKLV